jgi:hypothetical protein
VSRLVDFIVYENEKNAFMFSADGFLTSHLLIMMSVMLVLVVMVVAVAVAVAVRIALEKLAAGI